MEYFRIRFYSPGKITHTHTHLFVLQSTFQYIQEFATKANLNIFPRSFRLKWSSGSTKQNKKKSRNIVTALDR